MMHSLLVLLVIVYVSRADVVHNQLFPLDVEADHVDDVVALGSACATNATCLRVPNAHCVDEVCVCRHDFYVDHEAAPGECRLAPGFNERCASSSSPSIECRTPFVCGENATCECPTGFIQQFFQCIRDCPQGDIPTKDACVKGQQLGEMCTSSEECVQSYAQCLHGQCQCIAGANQADGACYPVDQCPMGSPATDVDGVSVECSSDGTLACPKQHYCMHTHARGVKGFCCPKIRMNCPIGKPLEGRNCSDCPWDTHHCFSYTIGVYAETMCCPNACPITQPIEVAGQCYGIVAFKGRCERDEQCAGIGMAECRDGVSTCQCPNDDDLMQFGRCVRQVALGEVCVGDEECRLGSNTVCSEGVCQCYSGYMPRPMHDAENAEGCIAEPSCPTTNGMTMVSDAYTECSPGNGTSSSSSSEGACSSGEFCREWWFDGDATFALCCASPTREHMDEICAEFAMETVMLDDDDEEGGVRACNVSLRGRARRVRQVEMEGVCEAGDHCLFNPFSQASGSSGICCRPVVISASSLDDESSRNDGDSLLMVEPKREKSAGFDEHIDAPVHKTNKWA